MRSRIDTDISDCNIRLPVLWSYVIFVWFPTVLLIAIFLEWNVRFLCSLILFSYVDEDSRVNVIKMAASSCEAQGAIREF